MIEEPLLLILFLVNFIFDLKRLIDLLDLLSLADLSLGKSARQFRLVLIRRSTFNSLLVLLPLDFKFGQLGLLLGGFGPSSFLILLYIGLLLIRHI